jgi:hypothetical protein
LVFTYPCILEEKERRKYDGEEEREEIGGRKELEE